MGRMATEHLIPEDLRRFYHVKEWRNATGVLCTACPDEWRDVQEVLRGFKLMKSEVMVGAGNRSLISRRIDEALYARGWRKSRFKLLSWSTDRASTAPPTLWTA